CLPLFMLRWAKMQGTVQLVSPVSTQSECLSGCSQKTVTNWCLKACGGNSGAEGARCRWGGTRTRLGVGVGSREDCDTSVRRAGECRDSVGAGRRTSSLCQCVDWR